MSKSTYSDLTPGGGKRPDFDQIKRAADVVAVIQSHGVALKREGRDYVGLCPFHDDKKPSLRVTPGKGLWRCMSCEASGNVIQFVARKEGIEEKAAALRLLSTLPGVQTGAQLERLEKKTLKPSSPVVPPAVAADLLARVAGFYTRTLHKDRAGLDYLASRKLAEPAMLETFRVGYCNGTLKSALPKSGEILTHLQSLGILNAKGNEVFYGRVTVPILDEAGTVVGLYGRKVEGEGARLNADSARHIYLAGGHRAAFNAAAAKHAPRLVFTEAIFDALALWQAGERGVVPLYGADGFTEHHAALLREMSAAEILLALDNDVKGRAATETLREKLTTQAPAVPVRVVAWPEGCKDAVDFFSSRDAAAWAALIAPEKTTGEEKPSAAPSPDAPEETAMPGGFALIWPTRRYEVMAVAKSGVARLKATVKAIGAEPGRFHVEALDLYSSRARRLFASEAARLFRVSVELAENDLARLLVAAERHQGQTGSGSGEKTPVPSAQDRLEALKLGRSADLVGAITRDLGKLGIVGEERNGLVLYLVLTSRKLDDPLAAQILSPSGSGKSHLQDAVLSLCPEEDLIKLTSLSSQALFYKGEDSLRHKALALEEVAGAEGARYALRNLISAKKLTIETTVKNPATGKMETQVNTVYGPTAVFETTTQPDTDPETKSRYLLLSIDESPEQTRLIAEAQRHRHTLDALLSRQEREAVRRRHHAFQRLLRPLVVVNPYEPLLGYGDERLTTRRDQPKYLNLILAVAFLHQLQRPVKTHPILGEYIEATLDDIAIANDLAAELFGASLDDLSPPGRRLAEQLAGYVEKEAEAHEGKWTKVDFGRRELREALKWSDTRLRVHLGELLRLEYLAPLCGANGSAFRYRLLVAPEVLRTGGGFVTGMRSVEELRKAANLAGRNGHPAATPPHRNGEVVRGVFSSENGHRWGDLAAPNGTHIPVNGSSHR